MTAPIGPQNSSPIQPQTFDQKYKAVSKHTAEISYKETKEHERYDSNNRFYDTEYFLDMYHQAAEGGVAEANLDFARIILKSKPELIGDAVIALKRGAEAGSANAAFQLANLCMNDNVQIPADVMPNTNEILELYQQAATGGLKGADIAYAKAILKLAPASTKKAIEVLQNNNRTRAKAINMLASMLITASPSNMDKAIELLENNRSVDGDKRLVSIYLKLNAPGGNERAITILKEHADKKEGWALFKLGMMYYGKDNVLAKQYLEDGVKAYGATYDKIFNEANAQRSTFDKYNEVIDTFNNALANDKLDENTRPLWYAALDALHSLSPSDASSITDYSANPKDANYAGNVDLRSYLFSSTKARMDKINQEYNTADGFNPGRLFSNETRYERLIVILNKYREMEKYKMIAHFTDEEKGAFYRDLGRLEYRFIAAMSPFRQNGAFRAWQEGSKLGNKDCMYFEGLCYKLGLGVQVDADKAKELWEKAAAGPNGNKYAQAELDGTVDSLESTLRREDGVEDVNGRSELKLKDAEVSDRIVASKSWLNRAVSWIRKDENLTTIIAISLIALAVVGVVLGLIALTLFFPHIMAIIFGVTAVSAVALIALGVAFAGAGH